MAASFQFFYTGANNVPQTDPSKSLGGYISNSPVGNAQLSAIFGGISQLTKNNYQKPECRCIAIYNNGTASATGLSVYINTSANTDASASDNAIDNVNIISASLKIGYTVPTIDACDDFYTEQLPTIYSTPLTTTLVDTTKTALALPNLAVGSYLCLFIQRTVNPAFIKPLTAQQYVDIYISNIVTLQTVEDFSLVFQWT